jgi:uncharacterized protein involved in cysteine biosynthesis
MPAAGNPYAAPGAMGSYGGYGQYEFNDLENGIIASTAGRARLWGIISIVVGGLNTLAGFLFFVQPALLANLFSGIVSIIVGVSFLGAAASLSNVVNTQGNDVAHMMEALKKVSSALMVQIVTTIIGFVLALVAVALAVLFFAAMASSSP